MLALLQFRQPLHVCLQQAVIYLRNISGWLLACCLHFEFCLVGKSFISHLHLLSVCKQHWECTFSTSPWLFHYIPHGPAEGLGDRMGRLTAAPGAARLWLTCICMMEAGRTTEHFRQELCFLLCARLLSILPIKLLFDQHVQDCRTKGKHTSAPLHELKEFNGWFI